MSASDDVAAIAARLTPAMAMVVDTLDYGDWFAADDADANGGTCNGLVGRGILERRSDPHTWGRSQYRRTPLGLAVRAHLASASHSEQPRG